MAEEMVRVGTYREFKTAMDLEVRNVTQGFVRMGYLLKVARDTDILAESGYKTVAEFAAAEYGMNETYVSRFIGINDRYSESGYSDRLQEKYQGYGMSLLAEMLTLPESIADAIPQGVGRLMISIRGKDQDIEVQNVRSLEKEVRTWVEFLYTLKLVYAGMDLSDPEASWEQVYGETYKEEEPQKQEQEQEKSERNTEKSERNTEKPDQDKREKDEATREQEAEHGKREESADSPERAGAEPNEKTSEGERVPEETEKAQEETTAEKPGFAPAQEPGEDEVNTVSNPDPEAAYEQCAGCRFHYPESPARAMAYEAVCKDCDDAEHFQARPEEPREKKVEDLPGEQAAESDQEEQIPGQDNIMNHPEYLPEGVEPEKTKAAVDGEPVHAQVEPTEGQVKEEALAYLSMIQGNIRIENYRKAREQGEHLLDVLKRLEGYRS